MSKVVLAVLAALFLAFPAFAQVVRVTKTDGKVVQGELLGYQNGKYRVRLTGGAVEEIEEVRIQDISLISPTGDRGPAKDSGALESARAAFERNELELAFQKISEALRSLDDDRSQVAELTARISAAYLDRLLEQKDAARFAEGLRQVLPTLSPATKRELFQKMADRYSDLHRTAPDDAFTGALGDALARLGDEGTFTDESRATMADIFLERAQIAAQKGDTGTALTLLRGAARIDPKRRESLKGRISDTALARAKTLLDKGDPVGSASAAREALEADPSNADAKKLLDQVEIAAFRSKIDASGGSPELAAALREFMKRSLSAEQRDWAEKALARVSNPSPEQAPQLATYFPVKAGRFLVYRRGDGELTERIRTDSIVREGETLRVYTSLKEIFRDYATTKAYLVEIEKGTVYLPTTSSEREPLLRFPCQSGDSWTWRLKEREFRRTVKSLGESVVVGREGSSKVFPDCMVVDFTSTVDRDGVPGTLTSRSTYAPGIGLVKLEYLDPQFAKFNLELIDSGQE